MGTICAPFYPNIFMDHFEKKYRYPFLQGLSIICYFINLRFIDDVFFIWTGTKEQHTICLNNLNKKHNSINFEYKISQTRHNSINFEYKISQTSITYLDTEVSIQNNKLVTKICRKRTDRQNFLYIDSDHAKSLKDSISFTQALRIKRICTTPNDFNHYCEKLKQRFVSQGYQPQLINKHI